TSFISSPSVVSTVTARLASPEFSNSIVTPPKVSVNVRELYASNRGGVNGLTLIVTGSDSFSPLLTAYKVTSYSSSAGKPSTTKLSVYKDDFASRTTPGLME